MQSAHIRPTFQKTTTSLLSTKDKQRLPSSVVEALKLKDGDQVEIQVAGEKTLVVARAPGERELLPRLRKFRGRLPKNFKI